MSEISIIIGSDMVPTKTNKEIFVNGDIDNLLGIDMKSILEKSDFRIFNLEVPITDVETPILKCGPNLIASTETIKGIKEINPTLLTLANNHILDQDIQGLNSTINILDKNNIAYIGVGDNLNEASKPYIIKKNGAKVGIYACAEHEFSIATPKNPGANPFDPLESLDHIKDLKEQCDYVIVLYHGGKEHYRYPSPLLQRVCRKIVEKGADIVISQHSHCIGCYEEFKGSTIVYGQGNFIFDHSESEFWKTSLLIKLNINKGIYIKYIPIVKEANTVRLATSQVADKILSDFLQRSNEIIQDGFVEQKYQDFAKKNFQMYLTRFSGLNKWLSRIDRKLLNGRLLKTMSNKGKLHALQNYFECESHRELVIAGLKGETTSERNKFSK